MGHLARWAVRRPVLAIVTFFLTFAVIGALGARFPGDMKDSFDLKGTESQVAQNLLAETSGGQAATGASATVVWGVENGAVTDASVQDVMTPKLKEFSGHPGQNRQSDCSGHRGHLADQP